MDANKIYHSIGNVGNDLVFLTCDYPRVKKKKRLKLIVIVATITLCISVVILCLLFRESNHLPRNYQFPKFEGVRDIVIEQGDGIAYRSGVFAYDCNGDEIEFTVNSDCNHSIPGTYKATYIATDKWGNTIKKDISVTVIPKPKIPIETLYALVDDKIEEYDIANYSKQDVAEFLYFKIKKTVAFVGDSDKSDWVAEAYRALTEGEGDCFTYYAVARAFFERLDIPVITVERTPNVRPGTHFWLLVNMGTEESPKWYHWDATPHYMEYPINTCLVTDDELLAYNEQVEHYYTFDMNKYPRTPKK